MEDKEYLFVYGTLRSHIKDPVHHLLETHAVLVAAGTFQGKLYDLGRYPGAVRSRGTGDRVIGEIYQLTQPQFTLAIVDEYEGHRFKRKRVTIAQENGQQITAWIYLYNGSVRHRLRILSGDYVRYRSSP